MNIILCIIIAAIGSYIGTEFLENPFHIWWCGGITFYIVDFIYEYK